MNFKETFEKVQESKIFKDFIEKNPKAELCAGFFIIDLLSNDNKKAIDYKIQDKAKIFTFDVRGEDVLMKEDKLITDTDHPPLSKINPDIKVEVEELKSIAGVKALDNGISAKFSKIIAVLQNLKKDEENKQIWNLTCMLEGLIILNILIDANTSEIIKFERRSMMDMIKKK